MISLSKRNRGAPSDPRSEELVEVWGDTVDRRQVVIAVFLGCTFAGVAFYGAHAFFTEFVSNASLARTYAMLVGLAAALTSAVISARLFPPKRELVEGNVDTAQQRDVIRELAMDPNGLGKLSDLTAEEKRELEELNLYELFRAAEIEEQEKAR